MFTNDIFMGQQIGHADDENLDAVHEHVARADLSEADYGCLSSRVEKFIKLAHSSIATRVHCRSESQGNCNIGQHLLQEGASMISSSVPAAQDTLPLHFRDSPPVNLSYDTDEHDVGVALSDVVLEPVGVYCHVPVREVCKVDIGCQTVNDSHHHSTTSNGAFECLLTETSSAKSQGFNSTNDRVTVNEIDVAKSKGSDEIFISRHGLGMDAKAGVYDAEPHCRSRPPQSPKLITTPAAVLQSAHESRPSEIGSYLAVAPVVSSSDLGLSPIYETAEVAATNAFLRHANALNTVNTSNHTPHKLVNHHSSVDAFSSRCDHTRLQSSVSIVHNSKTSRPDSSFVFSFDNNINIIGNARNTESVITQSDEGFVKEEGSINAEVIRTVNGVVSDRQLFGDASHNPVSIEVESINNETDRYAGTNVKNVMLLQDKDAVFSDRTLTRRTKSNIILPYSNPFDSQHQLSDSPAAFLSDDDSSCSPRTSTPHFVLADTVNLSKNKDVDLDESEHCDVCFSYPELDVHTPRQSRSNVDTCEFDPVWAEWESALSCCDFSTNNNESGNPKIVRMNMTPGSGPLTARRQVRHCSDGSAPLSSSLPLTASVQLRPAPPARSTSQLSLDDIIVSPRAVLERLDFRQLEIFEGTYFFVVC